jgi:hypothetical protein
MEDVSATPVKPESELTEQERVRLENAHRRLREAVRAYEKFVCRPLETGQPVPVQDFDEVAGAQAEVEAAERELWQVREEVLGWPRPPWAVRATHVADWFSPEDAAYDHVPEAGQPSRR